MNIERKFSVKKVIAQLLLLIVPTAAIAFYLLKDANEYYNILQNKWLWQGLAFSAGAVAAVIFFGYKFRFITTTAVLLILLTVIYKILNRIVVGEFETIFLSLNYKIFASLFFIGWITGFGLSRSKYFTIFLSVFLLALQIVLVSKIAEVKADAIIAAFAPVIVFSFYIIYTAELIRNMNDDEVNFSWFISKRIIGFGLLITLLLVSIFSVFKKDFTAIEKEWGSASAKYDENADRKGMMQENKDGTMQNRDQTELTGNLNRGGKRLVFVAKLDNYFEDGVTPNPLYFTSYYYTKFDTAIQAFEIDTLMPYNDLFKPDPSQIPLYFKKEDKKVIENTKATLRRKVVTAEVYKTILSPSEYIAPSTAFFCQPIPVEDAFKQQYRSAYRAKMNVSELNSAYFVYNPAGDFQLEAFQEERFSELRNTTSYAGEDKKFMDYYTFMPSNDEYKRIKELALDITKDAVTPVDKIIAIRDYFLSKDEFGEPKYVYSDNPGIPGIPSASKLNYFLFENRKGYCAYYAGATLFMMRALGIPSRVAAGFLTVDRSSKNPGWYWFYEDQAHAWVQAYFPGYGWIDFDTTVPDLNARESPQPDETPPLNMTTAYFVGNGKVVSIDTIKKRMQMLVSDMLYQDKQFATKSPQTVLMDVSIASVTRDSGKVALSEVEKGMDIVAVSYAEALKNIPPDSLDTYETVLNKIPKPVPIDEVKIMEAKQQDKKENKTEAESKFDWLDLMWTILGIITAFLLFIFSLPSLIWFVLHNRAKANKPLNQKAFAIHTAVMYYLNQLGYSRENLNPQAFAAIIDKEFNTNHFGFANIYQKIKYSNQQLFNSEIETVNNFYSPFIKSVQYKIHVKKRFAAFLNIYRTIHFFSTTKTKHT